MSLHAQLIEKESQLKVFYTEYSSFLYEFKSTCNKVFSNSNSKQILEDTRNNIAEVKSKFLSTRKEKRVNY